MSLKTKLLTACGGLAAVPAIEDYFSAYTYTGNGATQTITNGIDLAGKGGMVWGKCRNAAYSHTLIDTVRGINARLQTDGANGSATFPNLLTAFNSNGFTLGDGSANSDLNNSTDSFVSWSFAQGPKFFKVAQVVVSGSNQTVDLSSLGTVGMVTVKRTDAASAWYTWHKDLTAGNLVYLNTTAAQAASAAISVSGTTLTLTQATIGNGTYIVYAWAHDTASTGMIQCGTFTTDGSGNATVNLGWEPQWVLYKSTVTSAWDVVDSSRGLLATGNTDARLHSNLSDAEDLFGSVNINATGFKTVSGGIHTSETYVYMAIRRGPMKAPTVGTQVYNAIARTGTGAAATVTGVGFPPDSLWTQYRSSAGSSNTWYSRLRGATAILFKDITSAEITTVPSYGITSFNMDGVTLRADNGYTNNAGSTFINHFFKRAPGVFDEVCDTAANSNNQRVTHNLGVTPELIIGKTRSAAGAWPVYHADLGANQYLYLHQTAAKATLTGAWQSVGAATFGFDSTDFIGATTPTVVFYLFATLAGISKVGSYTGNGTTQTINAGFTTGARFILIKRTDSTGDWFVWDSTRGIVAGNDPHLSLNTTAAEVTTDDSIDPDASGFIVNQVAATDVNVTSATYIYLAFA
jgi:hypothetical protein